MTFAAKWKPWWTRFVRQWEWHEISQLIATRGRHTWLWGVRP